MAAGLKWHRKLQMIDSDKLNCGVRANNKNATDGGATPCAFRQGYFGACIQFSVLIRMERIDLIAACGFVWRK